MSIYIEHFGGNFPLWLAPIQAVVLPLSDKFSDYANKVVKVLKDEGIRVKLNDRADKIGSKIRQAELDKINFMLIVGQKESDEETVSVRKRFEGDVGAMPLIVFKDKIGRIRDIQVHPVNGKIYFLAVNSLWLMEKNNN